MVKYLFDKRPYVKSGENWSSDFREDIKRYYTISFMCIAPGGNRVGGGGQIFYRNKKFYYFNHTGDGGGGESGGGGGPKFDIAVKRSKEILGSSFEET